MEMKDGTKTRRTKEYMAWANMKDRCFNKNCKRYKDYGGRGITVCERWLTFKNFLMDMGFAPSKEYTLERDDNDGNYKPSNCRWATKKEQSWNKRPKVPLTYNGVTKSLAAWSREFGLSKFKTRKKISQMAREAIIPKIRNLLFEIDNWGENIIAKRIFELFESYSAGLINENEKLKHKNKTHGRKE